MINKDGGFYCVNLMYLHKFGILIVSIVINHIVINMTLNSFLYSSMLYFYLLLLFVLLFSTCKKFGQQSWIFCLIIITESLIAVKFLWSTVTLPPPRHIGILWICILIGLFLYTCRLFLPSLFRTIHAQIWAKTTDGKDEKFTKTE